MAYSPAGGLMFVAPSFPNLFYLCFNSGTQIAPDLSLKSGLFPALCASILT